MALICSVWNVVFDWTTDGWMLGWLEVRLDQGCIYLSFYNYITDKVLYSENRQQRHVSCSKPCYWGMMFLKHGWSHYSWVNGGPRSLDRAPAARPCGHCGLSGLESLRREPQAPWQEGWVRWGVPDPLLIEDPAWASIKASAGRSGRSGASVSPIACWEKKKECMFQRIFD